MHVAIIYDSETGTTERASEAMGDLVRAAGHEATVSSVRNADPATLGAADAICVGSWCKGLFVLRQHATEATMDFIDRLEGIDGKPAAVFCTYKTAVGGKQRIVPIAAVSLRRLRTLGVDSPPKNARRCVF